MKKLIVLIAMLFVFASPASAHTDEWTWRGSHNCHVGERGVLHWKIYGDTVTVALSPDPKFLVYYDRFDKHTDAAIGRDSQIVYNGYVHVDDGQYFINAWITCR